MKSLTKSELDALLAATPEPDRLMFLTAFNHGLRVSEVVNLDASNIVDGHLVVQRLKRSRDGLRNPYFRTKKTGCSRWQSSRANSFRYRAGRRIGG